MHAHSEFPYLEETIKVIDISASTDNLILKVLMNAEQGEAVGYLANPSVEVEPEKVAKEFLTTHQSDHWRWRIKMAEKIASELEPDKFGVKGIYIFGSTKNAVAGPGSDIDLLVYVEDNKTNIEKLSLWFEGWSMCLSEINYQRTGYRSEGILDVHFITDEDIAKKTSYAVKIGAITDAARPLKMKKK